MRKSPVLFAIGALVLLPVLAQAQNAITQNGSIIIGEIGVFRQDRQLGGASQHFANTGLGVKPFSITDSLSSGQCSNSAATSGQYNALCLGHDASGNGLITLDSFGGLPSKSLKFRLNGNNYDFPPSGGGNGNVVGPNTTTVGNLAFFNNTTGTLLKDDAWTWDGSRITGPPGKTITLQYPGVFQVGGVLGPYILNDGAADTVSIQAQPGALPSLTATNLQLYPPADGQQVYLNLTTLASAGAEQRLILGSPGSTGHYIFSQVYTGTGVCRDVDFLDGGPIPWFTLVCHSGGFGSEPAIQIGNQVPILGATTSSGSQSMMVLDVANALQLGQGSAIPAIAFNKHITSVGSSPSLSGCGTTPAISSATDTKGYITIGTGGPTQCTVSFAAPFATGPVVQLTGAGSGNTLFSTLGPPSTTSFTIYGFGADLSGKTVMYSVIQ